MSKKIREYILQSDLFDPSTGSSCGLDYFILNSANLALFEKGQVSEELDLMLEEGLVTIKDEKPYYSSTREGKIEKQKQLAQNGFLSAALANQLKFDLNDLILAIVVSDKVEYADRGCKKRKDNINIYLHEYSVDDINNAIGDLLEKEFIAPTFLYEGYLSPTALGWQKYNVEISQKLELNGGAILAEEIPVILDDRFNQLNISPEMVENLKIRWLELLNCSEAKAYLAATVLAASIVEGLLTEKLFQNVDLAMSSSKVPCKNVNGNQEKKKISDWMLHDCINVCADINLIPKSILKHTHELRDTRNFVHPQRQLKESIIIDESLFRISKEVADTIIDWIVRCESS